MIQPVNQDFPMLVILQTHDFDVIQDRVNPEQNPGVGLDCNALRGAYAGRNERLNFGATESGPHNRRGIGLGPVHHVVHGVVGNVSCKSGDVDWDQYVDEGAFYIQGNNTDFCADLVSDCGILQEE